MPRTVGPARPSAAPTARCANRQRAVPTAVDAEKPEPPVTQHRLHRTCGLFCDPTSFPEQAMKAAILVLSDPSSGSAEALGRVFNALAAAHDFKRQGDDVTVLFQGA